MADMWRSKDRKLAQQACVEHIALRTKIAGRIYAKAELQEMMEAQRTIEGSCRSPVRYKILVIVTQIEEFVHDSYHPTQRGQ
jgi:hypothetical protein